MRVAFIDTETTGTGENDQVIEVAYIVCDSEYVCDSVQVVGEHQRYKPTVPIKFGAMATHHIIEEDLEGEPEFSTFKMPENISYLIGHNVDFDWKMLGKPDIPRICTLALARYMHPQLDSHTQSALAYALSADKNKARLAVAKAHSAVDDVKVNIWLLHELAGEMRLTWTQMWELSEKARVPTHMRFGKHKGAEIKDLEIGYAYWLLRQPDLDPYLATALKKRIASKSVK